MLFSRSLFSLVAVNGYIYAIGGNGIDELPTASVERCDIRNNVWTAVNRMATPRAAAAAVVLDGDIVVIGGNAGKNRDLDSAEKFDGKAWTTVVKVNT